MADAVLWVGGQVFTGHRYCEALLVDDGRVVFAGSSEGAHRDAPTGTEVVPLRGRLLVPGLIDAHVHLAELTRAREGLDLKDVRSIAELAERVNLWAKEHPGGPVVGRGWNPEQFAEGRWPTARDLADLDGDRPVILYHASGHAALVSEPTLRRAGVDERTPDPPNGRLGRTIDGAPDGLLYEDAMRIVAPIASSGPPTSPDALRRTVEYASSLGLTTVATMNTSIEELEGLRGARRSGPLPLRVRSYLRLTALDGFLEGAKPEPTDFGDEVRVVGVKGFTDGAFGPRTAWLSRPYSDAPGESGLPLGTEAGFEALLGRAVEHDLAPALHAIGDRALVRALELLERAGSPARAPGRVEHAALTPPGVLLALDRVRPALVVQPGFLWSDWWLGDRLGSERARSAYAFRTLLDRGHRLAGSSDAPYDPLDPWRGIRAAVQRTGPDGRSANPTPTEVLSAEAALQLYTIGGGAALGEPDLGSLEPGARADLVVLATDDLEGALAAGIGRVEETWMGGQPVYPGRRGGGTVKP